MRFFLDNDVDRRCRNVLAELGHEVWTTPQAGRSLASDASQQDYASRHNAVLITHDRAFTRNRKYGRHVLLRVEQPLAPGMLELHLHRILPVLERHSDITVTVRPTGATARFGNGGNQRL